MESDPPTLDADLPEERRVLLLPPTPRDASAIRRVFDSCGVDCRTYSSMSELCGALGAGAAAAVVSEESLVADPESLLDRLGDQPVWSDLPVIVLSRSGSESPKLSKLLERIGNVSVVERPVRISTFLSVVRVAIRGRLRQYEVREHLKHLRSVEAERTALWESERAARAEAERAGRMKDEFLATLSHEIRTPLNAILGWTHLLGKNKRSGEEIDKGLAVIERNAKAQSQIVADLLDMNRIINGKVRLDVQRVDLAGIIRAAVDTVAPAADAKGIRLEVVLAPPASMVSGDPERLQQVFWNLLSNAVKFTPSGQRIHVLLDQADSHLEVRVIDTGEGIDPEFLPHVFDRFRQADGSTTRRHGGLGLGLAIVKQLVELHGGRVRAHSPGPGMGSTFFVILPIAMVQDDQPAAPDRSLSTERPAPALPALIEDIGRIKILVVDDEPDSRDIVKRLLEAGGAHVITASSAREALALIPEERPQVLISDIGMPREDGYSLVRSLRALPEEKGGRTVAIALTAYARPEDRVTAIRSGFQFHIAKPVEAAALLAVVADAARTTAAL